MILVVGGIKGGSGKTTIATNLTALRSKDRHKVLLVDADEQKSSSDWCEQRNSLGVKTEWTTIQLSGKSVFKEIGKLCINYDDVIIDTGGRDNTSQRSALAIADVFVIPFRPKSLDIWTVGKVNDLIEEVQSINPNIICYALVNQADYNGHDNMDAISVISEFKNIKCLPGLIIYRKSFSSASAQGLAVHELNPLDKKAIKEMRSVYDDIYKKTRCDV